ncbi:MAG: threonine--tRNA ligase [Spirochaetota bacterium]|nr:threonine--tRNA ligase [Spirochaetota bacterium]
MAMVQLNNGKTLEIQDGKTLLDVIAKLNGKSKPVAARINGALKDLRTVVTGTTQVELISFDSVEGRDVFWHSASHLMAQAVKRLFPEVKVSIGPAIDTGFYYDFDKPGGFTQEDLEKIEEEMRKIVTEDIPIIRKELLRKDAIDLFSTLGEIYKVELLQELSDDIVSLYEQGDFVDLCRGPHLPSTGYIKAFKLLSIAGAYWRGDEKNKMLQRIYGVAFPDEKMLQEHLAFLEEVKKRDHRVLGKELDLFSIHEDAGGGLIYWHPKGGRLRAILEQWWREEHFNNGYEILYTPHIGRATLWETSGHLDFYKENMYSPMDIDGNDYYIKPMNCPFHIKIYQTSLHSYRDLPLRWAELGTVYRYEKSGVLHGLLRVRGFTQDDAHIFCTPEQMEDEVREVLRFSLYMWKVLGFSNIKAYLATRPQKSVGEEKRWIDAQESLKKAVQAEKLDIEVDEGGGAFYGPKIDLKVKDALGREWQMTTIQFDFNLPDRFDLYYIGCDGQKHRPYMIHRALLGSIERFIGILTEHYAGRFPVWLSPVQIILVNVGTEQAEYTKDLALKLRLQGIRVKTDLRDETIKYKIRDAIEQRVPYIGVIGGREMQENTIAVRKRGEQKPETMKVDEFVAFIQRQIANKQ